MSIDRMGGDRDPAPALTRGVYILRILAQAQGEPVALADLARTLEAAKSSTSYLCTVLEDASLIRRVGNGYVLGHGTVELGGAYLRSFNEVREFYRFCNEAPTLSEQVVQMAMLQGSDVVYLARHEGRSPLRLTANLGDRFPAASTAVGNALLAALADDDIADRFRYRHAFPMRTSESVKTLLELMDRLAQVRERGYAVDEGGVHPGISGVAVRMPPRSSSSPAIAIGCSFLTSATSTLQREAIVAELRELERLLENPMQPHNNL